jgi:DNA-binding PadR family transcriptional regulator
MALEGNLSSFGLEEILQLIAVQQKTGMLSVTANDRSSVLFFRDGKIISTRDRRSKTRDPFRDYLTRYGCLKREELAKITQISSQSKLDLLDVIISEGFFDEKKLKRHWRNHIQESLHEVITWDQLSYKFVSGDEVVSGVKSMGDFAVEPLLMECMRRIDEYPMLLQTFPADGVRISSTGRTPDADAETMESEKTVLALLDSPKTVRDIVARAQLPSFDVYEALKLLKEKGLITVEEDLQAGLTAEGTISARIHRKKRGNPTTVVAAVFMFASCLMFGAWRNTGHVTRIAREGAVSRDPAARARVEYHVRFVVEAFRAETGVYPPTLEALREHGFVDGSTLQRAADFDLRYKLTRDGTAYTLL